MSTPNDPTMSADSLDAVIASYVQAVESGQVPDRQELLEAHPELYGRTLDWIVRDIPPLSDVDLV